MAAPSPALGAASPAVGRLLLLEALTACSDEGEARQVVAKHVGSSSPSPASMGLSSMAAAGDSVMASSSMSAPARVVLGAPPRGSTPRHAVGATPRGDGSTPLGAATSPLQTSSGAASVAGFKPDSSGGSPPRRPQSARRAAPQAAAKPLSRDAVLASESSESDVDVSPPAVAHVSISPPASRGPAKAGGRAAVAASAAAALAEAEASRAAKASPAAGSGAGAADEAARARSRSSSAAKHAADSKQDGPDTAKGSAAVAAAHPRRHHERNHVSVATALAQDEPDPPSVGVWSMQCKRQQHDNEDRARCVLAMPSPVGPVDLFAVIDGHGGGECATFTQDRLHEQIAASEAWAKGDFSGALTQGFAACEKEFMALGRESGACVVAALLVGGGIGTGGADTGHPDGKTRRRRLFVACCGDCRAILAPVDGSTARQVTRDHKPSDPDERKRVEEAGGLIFGNPGRLFGIIAVSRSLGDMQLKGEGPGGTALSPVPEVYEVELSDDGSNGDGMLVMACDGIWDELTNEAAAVHAAFGLSKGAKRAARKLAAVKEAQDASAPRVRDPGAHLAARAVVVAAAETGYDDCTAVVVPLVGVKAHPSARHSSRRKSSGGGGGSGGGSSGDRRASATRAEGKARGGGSKK